MTKSQKCAEHLRAIRFSKSELRCNPGVADSLQLPLRFGPRERGLKGGDGVEERVAAGWQRETWLTKFFAVVMARWSKEAIRARKRVDEAVQLCVG